MSAFQIRPLEPTDSLEELTDFLHRAYADLLDRGLNYVAATQDVETTRRRIDGGQCLIAEAGGRMVGTITWHDPTHTKGAPWYARADVASFEMYAVAHDARGAGVGLALLREVEERARAAGAAELACDTAVPATGLIAMYEGRGYRVVDRADWPDTNYESVILSKRL